MKIRHIQRLVATLIGCAFLLTAESVLAAWNHNPLENNLVSTGGTNKSRTRIVTDGQGGHIISYVQHVGGDSDVFVQRIDADGNAMWDPTGVRALNGYGYMALVKLVADGSGGAFLIIQDSHDGIYYYLYVQHITSSGTATWGPNGVQVTISAATTGSNAPNLFIDGAGGCIVAFDDNRNGDRDVYGQRLSAAGTRLWSDEGKVLCGAVNYQQSPKGVYDENGFFLVWRDSRDSAINDADLYANRYDLNGNPLWDPDGNPVAVALKAQTNPEIVLDGQGGVVIAWSDYRNSSTNDVDLYAQRLNVAGSPLWDINGVPVCEEASGQYSTTLTADGYGGAFVTWTDYRATTFNSRVIYAQALAADGIARWATDGIPAGDGSGDQNNAEATLTTDGNLAVVWQDLRSGGSDIYAQMFSYNGVRLGDNDGQLISSAPFAQISPGISADGDGGVIVVFQDGRNPDQEDIFAQRMDRTTHLGDPAAIITGLIDFPQDQGRQMILGWAPSHLDGYQQPGIYNYSIWQRLVGGPIPALSTPSAKSDGQPSLSADNLLVLQQAGWSYAGYASAEQFDDYSVTVFAYADSTSQGTPVTEFMVLTETIRGNIESNVIGGWSVDNLAPGAPLFLNGALVGGDANLGWNSSGYHDEDLLQYNLYRSSTPDVVLDEASFLASSPDTSYIDAALTGGSWYYVVTAVDIHGNEGPPSNEATLQSVSAVGDNQLPTFVAIQGVWPNPFNPTTNLKYGLPATGLVRLVVYDIRGQKIRTLVDQVMSAGQHSTTWDGRSDDGPQQASGIYFARLEALGQQSTFKLVLMK